MGSKPSQVLSPLGVVAAELSEGRVYFIVSYIDDDCLVPAIDTLVFLGRNLQGELGDILYFQDAESHHQVGAYPSAGGEPTVTVVAAAELPPNLFELKGVVDELGRCMLRSGKGRGG